MIVLPLLHSLYLLFQIKLVHRSKVISEFLNSTIQLPGIRLLPCRNLLGVYFNFNALQNINEARQSSAIRSFFSLLNKSRPLIEKGFEFCSATLSSSDECLNNHEQTPSMKEPDFTFRTHSIPTQLSTLPAECEHHITPDEEVEEAALFKNIQASLRSKNAQIRVLDYGLQHQLSLATAHDDVFKSVKSDLNQKEKELELVRGCNKELRSEFSRLNKEHKAEINKSNERIQQLECEIKEANEQLFGVKGAQKSADILNEELRVQKTLANGLATEVGLLRKAKTERDIAIDKLEKEKIMWNTEKKNLVKERDEVKEEKRTLKAKAQGLDDLVTQRERTMKDRSQEIKKLEWSIQNFKDEKENYKACANQIEDNNQKLEAQVQELKRKRDNTDATLWTLIENKASVAKRPRNIHSATKNNIPAGPRAMVNGSPGSQRSASICSATDGRQVQLPGNEVRMRESSQKSPYSRRG